MELMTNLIPGDGPTSDDAALDATDPGTLADIADVDPGDQPVPTQPYVFDAADVEPAARVLDAVFATLRSGWEGWGAVETAVTELDVTLPDSCRRALGEIAARPLRMEPKGTPGAELDTSAGFGFDAASSASTDELALWSALIDTVSAPAAIARLGELLFARRAPRPGDHAHRAAQAYFDAVAASDFEYHATVHLLRGWTLARQLKDQTLENTALEMMTRRIDTLMEGEYRQKPGAVYPLLQVLCRPPHDTTRAGDQRKHASAVLSTLAVSETHDHLIEETARLRRSLLDATSSAEQRSAVDLDEIHGYCRRADDAPHPLVRLHFLERAAKVATMRGQLAEANRITALMQDIEPADLGMQVISTSTSLPAWMPESALDPYTQASTWHTGVAMFCTDPCAPTGSVARTAP